MSRNDDVQKRFPRTSFGGRQQIGQRCLSSGLAWISRLCHSPFALLVLIMSESCESAPAAEPALPVFGDVTTEAGIQFKHSYGDAKMDNIVKASGAGAMFFDYDGDGWLDIYLCCGRYNPEICSNLGRRLRGQLRNALYRNNGDGTFPDVTEQAGVAGKRCAFGCSSADVDNDGDLDLYILNYGPNEFYLNNGDGTFTDVSQAVETQRSALESAGGLVRRRSRRTAGRLRGELPDVRRHKDSRSTRRPDFLVR